MPTTNDTGMSESNADDPDARDMARLAQGHEAALNDLMERHALKLYHYLLRALLDASDAADLAQETFIRVYRNRTRFEPKQKFSTWLYTIAINLMRDRFRWRARHPQVSLDAINPLTDSSFADQMADTSGTPSEDAQREENARAVQQAIAALPEELRVPLVLAEYEEKPQAEIAAILGCTVKAVETRIYRARKQLRTRLEPLISPDSR